MGFWRSLWEDFKAWRRNEKRVRPRGERGRVYARKNENVPSGGSHDASARGKATLSIAVTRADGTVEHHEFPAEMHRLD